MNLIIEAFLIDDEKDSREVMSRLLQHYVTDIEIVGQAANVETAIPGFSKHGLIWFFSTFRCPKPMVFRSCASLGKFRLK